MMSIRTATSQDRGDIKRIYLSAFAGEESEIVAQLAVDLLAENTTLPTLSLLAETDGSVAGHVAYSPVVIADNEAYKAYILAPLAVHPDYQKQRIGSSLIEYGLQELSALGVNAVFVYGDPEYYGRFGFNVDTARSFTAPYKLQYPSGWQVIVLNQCPLENAPVGITCVRPLSDPELW